ncbi:sigma-70 family RNA polymerase sigma factor [Flavobacteriaceae bacterium R38]|nr:sigma-70 family RNA polymerase sigma factor [Flavobacteriaceae bacterium R38]
MEKLTDEELMNSIVEGNLNNMRYLFERHHKYVFNFLLKMCGDKVLSEDLTQEVFYKIIKHRATYNNGKFTSWMFTIARNSLASHFRKNNEVHDDLEKVAFGLTDEDNMNNDYSHLHKALEKLPVSDRELIVLNRFHEIKYEELSQIVQSTPGAVKVKVNRALKKLKNIYFQTI